MKRVVAILALLVACKSPTEPTIGYVQWTLDGASCRKYEELVFYIDGVEVGTEALATGQRSKAYETFYGPRQVGARSTDNVMVWNAAATVPRGDTLRVVLVCQYGGGLPPP